MARKQSLSDLIQEEAQKFNPSEGEPAIEVNAQAVVEEEATTPDETSQQPLEIPTNKRTNPTKADLEAIIKELKASLETSQQNEKALQQQIADLQSALTEQQASVERVTKELDDAKKTVLQLAEANSQLIEENKSLKEKPQPPVHKPQEQPSYKPVTYRKSHRITENLPTQPNESPEDFSANTWLYD